MLESLYEKAVQKKGILNKDLKHYDIKNIDVYNYWKKIKIAKSNKDFTLAAGDGSLNKKKFLSFNFYAIASESLIYNNELIKIENSEINIIPHSKFVEDRLRNYMGIFEVKSALKLINDYDIDYYLYDGSILGDLIRPFPLEEKIPKEVRYDLLDLFEDNLRREINSYNVEISSSKVVNTNSKVKSHPKELKNYNTTKYLGYLENIEKLLSLSYLLKDKEKIIAISKTSTATDYFDLNIPDIAIFDKSKFSRETGYSSHKIKSVNEEKNIKHEFPVENDFFKSLTFTIFYVRIEKNKNILKVELPYKATEDEIRDIIEIIAKDSIEGYPYLLKKAHHDVVIRKKDIEQLSKIVGLYERTGREML
ncbi:NurA domain protein [Methanobrevibacter cuticularis]|uniref:NurA domain protein n=1 Tax=Methanobrevibacter cuticularis TaxID=47311 RepID=A0A166FBK0_9EURY|nr:DNA double-strand break repair nuclease NurA [Methanobrevibacter cuticularis]KZX17503.1 NurA domain protein [Methanobrevibacter cuticularis]